MKLMAAHTAKKAGSVSDAKTVSIAGSAVDRFVRAIRRPTRHPRRNVYLRRRGRKTAWQRRPPTHQARRLAAEGPRRTSDQLTDLLRRQEIAVVHLGNQAFASRSIG